jgi:hypothetical protein
MSDIAGVTDGAERFEADADARGLDVEIIEHLEAQNLAQLAEMLRIEPADVVKSYVRRRRSARGRRGAERLVPWVPGPRCWTDAQ